MNIRNIPISELKPYENNPRLNDVAMRYVENSIKEFGFKVPIVVDKNNVIVAGHTRYKAAKHLGMTELPCVIADDLTDEQIKAFRIADNSSGAVAEWDDDLLKIELADISFDMALFGLDDEEDDEDDDGEEKGDSKAKYKKMELRAFEHYDYLVFVFDNQFDFINAAEEFGITKVDSGYSHHKIGIGRVIKGEKLVEKLGHKGHYIEPFEI